LSKTVWLYLYHNIVPMCYWLLLIKDIRKALS